MNKKVSVILIVFGLILLSLGLVDTFQGFTFAVTSWSDNFNDNIIDTEKWVVIQPATGAQVREENQRLKLLWTGSIGSVGLRSTSALNLENYYVQISILAYSAGEISLILQTQAEPPYEYYQIYKQYSTHALVCRQLIGGVETTIKQTTFTSGPGNFKLRVTSGNIEFYADNILVHSTAYAIATKNLYVRFLGYSTTTSNVEELDDFIYSGDGSEIGNLNIKGYYDSVAVDVTNVYYRAPDGSTSTPISVPASGYTWSGLAVGTYTVYGTYQGTTNNTSVTVSAGQTTYAQLKFVSSPQYGSLNVKGYYDAQAVAMTDVYYQGPSGSSSHISVPSSGYTWTELTPGSYTVYGTYQSVTVQTTVSVIADQTASAQLNFGGSPPQTGDLNIKGYYDMALIAFVDCFYRAPDGSASTPISVPASGYTWSGLSVGTYTVYGTYQGTTKQTTISVVAGQTAYAELVFTSSSPSDLLKWLKDLLNDGTVRSGMMLGGVCMVGFGFVVLAYPRKKPTFSPFFS